MFKINKSTFFIVLAIIILLGALAATGIHAGNIEIKGANEIRYGIDINGGVEAVYYPKDYDGVPSSDDLNSARTVIENRLDAKNITDREVTVNLEQGLILVRFPWKSDETDFNPQAAIAELGETAMLTFRDPEGNVLIQGTNVVDASYFYSQEDRDHQVLLKFDEEGAKKFEEATGRLIGQTIGIYMDETMISEPQVEQKISGNTAVISKIQTIGEAKDLAIKINSGSLPFSLETKNYSSISPIMGSNALDLMVNAGLVAFILVCIFMVIVYRLPGFVAVFALSLQVIGQLLALSIPQYTLTLPGIAAVILSIGMGVDANIITSERIREELATGKTIRGSIKSGFHKAFSSVFDGNITVMIVSVILMIFGSGTMKSFGYSLLTGVILNFLCGITVSKLMITSLSKFSFLQKIALYGRPFKEHKIIGFFKSRFKYYIISGAVLLVGIICMFTNGVNLDIQFQGGAIIKYTYENEIDTIEVENVVQETLGRNCDVQTSKDLLGDVTKLVLNLSGKEGITANDQDRLNTALESTFPDNTLAISEISIVEPFIGKQFAINSIRAIIIASILIILYVWFSFRKVSGLSAGVSGLIALLHDVVVVFLTFIIFGIPVNDSFIAAALTILGFSINDTIVIFDRIRENKEADSRTAIETLVDQSITQSFTRSLNTSLCTLLSIVIVYIFACLQDIESIKTFALPMIFGIISGCYSTICIAGPIWTSWQKYKLKKLKAKK